jgi:glycosyltransferase involved in cell wall biosynthesis/tetratricopeptide (TPR) repeat protein
MIYVLHIIKELSRGGATLGMINTAKHTSETGGFLHSVISISDSEPEARVLALNVGMRVINKPSHKELCSEINKADIVQIHFWNTPEMYSLLKSDLPDMRLMIRFNVNGHHAPHIITKDLIDYADYILASSPYVYEAAAFREFSESEIKNKSSMLYATTDFSKFKDFTPVKHSGFNVGYVGTVDFIKMHPDYVSISSQIKIPDVKFIVCGSGGDSHKLKNEAAEMSISHKFCFKDYVDNIQSIYEQLDVFGYPLCEDNYSTVEFVLQEAMYLGIPPVVFAYGGAQRTVKHNYSGLIVHSAKEYSEAIEFLYKHPGERRRLSKNGKEHARNEFVTEMSTTDYIKIYQKIMLKPKRKHQLVSQFQDHHLHINFSENDALNTFGAELFIDSQKTAVPQFFDHLFSNNVSIIEHAEEQIKKSSHLLYRHGISAYRRLFPDDSYLPFWEGLVNLEQNHYVQAYTDFKDAVKNGIKAVHTDRYVQEIHKRIDPLGFIEILAQEKQWNQAIELFVGWLKSKRNLINTYRNIYIIALIFHKNGFVDVARRTYKQLMDLSFVDDEIMGWVYFKYGEMLLGEENKGAAADMFRTAVKYKPDLYKALFYLNPETEPLNILISYPKFEVKGYISIEMDIYNTDLWDYYFRDICIDTLYLPSLSDYGYGIDEFKRIIACVSNYINPDGILKVKIDNTMAESSNIKQLLEIANNYGFISNKENHPVLTPYGKNQFIFELTPV